MIYFFTTYITVAIAGISDFWPKLKKIGLVISIVFLSMLAGLRNMGGLDFEVYQSIYYGFGVAYFSDEIGYIFLNNLFSWAGVSYNIFLFCYTLAAVIILVLFLHKHTKYPSFALMFYMACYFFFYNMVLNRQMICMSLALWAIYYWDKNKIYSLLTIGVGVLFHNSLVVLLPCIIIYEFLKHTKGSNSWVAFFVFLILFTIFITPERFIDIIGSVPGLSFIGNRLYGYLQKEELSTYTLNNVEYVKMFIGMAVIVPCIKKILLNKENRIWLFMYFIGLILLVWTRNIEILFRIFVYFDLSLLVLLPLCLDIVKDKFSRNNRAIMVLIAYICMGILALASIMYRVNNFNNGAFWQYQFYFLEMR